MSNVVAWAKAHPKLTAWIVLGIGMVAILVYEARDVGLLAGQWAALVVATVAVAGLCVWIIGWEDDDETGENAGEPAPAAATANMTTTTPQPAAASAPRSGKGKKKRRS